VARFLVWYGVAGAAGAWALQLLIGDGVEESACSQGASSTEPWLLVLTLGLGLVAAGSLGAAFVTWRGVVAGRRDPRGVVRFLAVTGMAAGVFFLVLIALGGLQLVTLDSCDQG
jgi:hypothetical protein